MPAAGRSFDPLGASPTRLMTPDPVPHSRKEQGVGEDERRSVHFSQELMQQELTTTKHGDSLARKDTLVRLREYYRRSSEVTIRDRSWYLGQLKSQTIIDPRTNMFIAYWDGLTTLALLFVALVTPVEVSFLKPPPPSERWDNGLFLINRYIDVVFILDMIFQFRIAYATDSADGTRWILNGYRIARHYGCSWWFALDFFSVMTSLFDLVGSEGTEDLKVLRAVRTLRLIKLVKLARGSRIFKRWEMRISINYSYLTLGGIMSGILITCHWIACIWGLQASFWPLNSWLAVKGYCIPWGSPNETMAMLLLDSCRDGWTCDVGNCAGGICTDGAACVGWVEQYSYALYFSVMTITSVGYGDITASTFNVTEQLVLVVIMLVTGMLWGYLIGASRGRSQSVRLAWSAGSKEG